MSNVISMPNRLSMNVTLPKQTQGKNFGEKVNDALYSGASAVSQGAALLGSTLPGGAVISAAVSSINNLVGGTSGASYAATGVVGLNGSSGSGSGPNLIAGAATGGIGQYNTDIASMSAQNSQMLQVQMAMQRENTMFSSISNVLKTKHDTAKNSISNIR